MEQMKKTFLHTIRIRNAVRVLFLAAFVVLVLTGRVKLWMGIFALGVVASFFTGRIYCGWICPMNSVMQAAGKNRFRGIFGSKGHPGKRGTKLPGWIRIIPLLLLLLLLW
jgi:ferredoxin-type protein NapH